MILHPICRHMHHESMVHMDGAKPGYLQQLSGLTRVLDTQAIYLEVGGVL
jgi:hypothetical protein